MSKLDSLIELPIVEYCDCSYCSKINKAYIYKICNSIIYFYCWEDNSGNLVTTYMLDCPYRNDWDMFEEITFETAFELLDEETQLIVIFNLDLFGDRTIF